MLYLAQITPIARLGTGFYLLVEAKDKPEAKAKIRKDNTEKFKRNTSNYEKLDIILIFDTIK